jgi:hypothetical protein
MLLDCSVVISLQNNYSCSVFTTVFVGYMLILQDDKVGTLLALYMYIEKRSD